MIKNADLYVNKRSIATRFFSIRPFHIHMAFSLKKRSRSKSQVSSTRIGDRTPLAAASSSQMRIEQIVRRSSSPLKQDEEEREESTACARNHRPAGEQRGTISKIVADTRTSGCLSIPMSLRYAPREGTDGA